MQVRLMVVDDSAFMRKIVSDAASKVNGVTVVGTARNGLDAIENIERYHPSIITMDVEMPKMNGIEALKIIKRDHPEIEVIMLSSHSKDGSLVTMEALELGALDFIEKSSDRGDLSFLTSQLEAKLLMAELITKPAARKERTEEPETLVRSVANQIAFDYRKVRAVVLGASTGGPKVLFDIVRKMPSNLNLPVFIVQHMPKGFTRSFAERMNGDAALKVVEAEDGMPVEKNVVYVAPGDYHMVVDSGRVLLNQKPKLHGVRPAADFLMESLARQYGSHVLAVILTGMGKDGAAGLMSIKEAGGHVLAQSKETCVVYGMPGYAVSSGVVDEVLSPLEISERIQRIVKVR